MYLKNIINYTGDRNKSILFCKSFTLIEMIVTVSVLLISLPAFFAIILSIFSGQAKFLYLQKTKQEGDYVLDYISSKIRSETMSLHSSSLVSTATIVCPASSDGSSLYFKVKKPNEYYSFKFYLSGGIIHFVTYSRNGASLSDLEISTSKVVFENLSFSCKEGKMSSPMVLVSFDVKPNINEQKFIKTLYYKTGVKLRSF